MSHRKAHHELNSVIGDALAIQVQKSHTAMINSVLKPIASNLEIKLTLVRVHADESTAKIKQTLPAGFQVKKVPIENLKMDVSNYSVLSLTRLTGQTISIYPNDLTLAIESIKSLPIIVVSEKVELAMERRKGKLPLKFIVYLPKGWFCTSYENSGAQDNKSSASEFTHAIYKLYADFNETGEICINTLTTLKLQFLSEFYTGPDERDAKLTDFMPNHRMLFIILDTLTALYLSQGEK